MEGGAEQKLCCPIGSEPALMTDYKPLGTEFEIDGLPVYTNGSGENVIIVFYDIFGYNGGRVKLICDQLAEAGFCVYLPDLYRGDLWSPDEEIGPKTFEWLKQFNMDAVMEDMNKRLLPHAKDKGGKNFGAIGFCWGCTPMWNLGQDEILKAGVGFHPSLQTTGLYGQDVLELTKTLKAPQMLLTSKHEAADV